MAKWEDVINTQNDIYDRFMCSKFLISCLKIHNDIPCEGYDMSFFELINYEGTLCILITLLYDEKDSEDYIETEADFFWLQNRYLEWLVTMEEI